MFVFLVADFDVFLPRFAVVNAGVNFLPSVALATVLSLAVACAVLIPALRLPQTDVLRYIVSLLGSPGGQAAGALYVLLLVLGAARPLAGAGLIGEVAFGWWAAATPPLILSMAATCAFLARQDLKKVALFGEYAALAGFLLLMSIGLTVSGRVNWGNYTPVPAGGWGPVWRGAVHLLGSFSPAYVLLLLVPRTRSSRSTVGLTLMTFLLVGFVMAIGTLFTSLHGSPSSAASFIPALQLLSDAAAGTRPWFFDAAVLLWMLGLLVKAVIALWLLALALAQTAGKDLRGFLLPAGAVAALTGVLLWSNAGDTYVFLQQYFRYFSFSAAVGIPLLLLLPLKLRREGPGENA